MTEEGIRFEKDMACEGSFLFSQRVGLLRSAGPGDCMVLKFLISELCNMMAPSGACGSRSSEGAGGRGFNLTDLFGNSSSGNFEADLNQPAPDSPNPGEPTAPPIAESYRPL
ncbi:hypothetical protein HAX54_053405 [Datura stramonium]|uniref:Uncharacterized protein n=1 Tax=Datura stramonium TaxID=4076 RepID=A0ABS8T1B1_DATST|nr:hypothetical protein [Datura stramonium]